MPDLKKSILIVEDEESVRTSYAMVLSELGLRVRSASDGLAALMGRWGTKPLTFCSHTSTCRACPVSNYSRWFIGAIQPSW